MSATQSEQARRLEVLVVEDNPGDVELIRESFKETTMAVRLNVVYDGVEAIDYLTQTGRYASATRPDLVILDLNLPKKDGREVLKEIKASESLIRIPVVVLTSSQHDRDVLQSFSPQRIRYMIKPIELEQFLSIAPTIKTWLESIEII